MEGGRNRRAGGQKADLYCEHFIVIVYKKNINKNAFQLECTQKE